MELIEYALVVIKKETSNFISDNLYKDIPVG